VNILINAYTLTTGGGKRILMDFIYNIENININIDINIKFYFYVPNILDYSDIKNPNMYFFELPKLFKKKIMQPFVKYYFNYNIKKYNIDKIFSMGNIALQTIKPQLLLLHWAYAVYPEKDIWEKMDFKSFINRKLRLYLFKTNLKYATCVVLQTKNIEKRLKLLYKVNNTIVIPNSVDHHYDLNDDSYTYSFPEGKKLLYLTHFYTHKNLEILIPLAKIIKKESYDYKIIITIEENQHYLAKKFLKDIRTYQLESIICNIGPVTFSAISSLYKQCDALIMPTLLESFGLTYIEAMYFNLPILTSDRDFAHDVCKDSAYYFDPLDELSILNAIDNLFLNKNLMKEKLKVYPSILKSFGTNKDVAKKYIDVMIKL